MLRLHRIIFSGEGHMKKRNLRQRVLTPRRTVLLLSFLLPVAIMSLAWGVIQFWPVGDRSPLTIDLYHQYVSFLSELRRKTMNFESLFYSWRIGLGTNFYALLAYYAASPLNIFLPLFPMEYITEAVSFLTVTKLGFAGLSFSYMLINSFGKEGLFSVRSKERIEEVRSEDYGGDALIVAFSVAYALCAFNLAFSWDVMWLDVTAALPLVVLGVHKLVREGKVLLYALSLAFCLFANYYIAFFVCIFTALYFFVAYFSAKASEDEAKELVLNGRKKSELNAEELFFIEENQHPFLPIAIRFAIVTLVGAAISAFLLFPTAVSLADTSAAGDKFPSAHSFRFSAFDFITHQLMTIQPSIRSGLPNIYNGILAFTLLPLYIFSTKIRLKEKLPHLILLGFLFLSFNSNFLDFIWHGMHYPNQLPYRYSFLFSFLLLVICFRTLTVIREFTTKTLVITTAIGIGFVILAEEFNADLLEHGDAYINLFFFFIYLLLFMFIWKRNYFRTVCLLLTVVMLGEISINTILTVGQIAEKEVYTSKSTFVGDIAEVNSLIDKAYEEQAGDFFRMEVLPAKTTNDGALYGYPGYTLFSSTSREKTAKFMRKFAYHGNNINSYKYVQGTPVGDALFGIQYFLIKNGATRDTYLEEVARSGEMTLLRNPHALEVGAVANLEFKDWRPNQQNPFRNWDNMLKQMLGQDTKDVFEAITPKVKEGANFNPHTGDGSSGMRFTPEDTNKSTLMRLEIPIEEAQHLYLAFDVSKTTKVELRTRNESQLIKGGDVNLEEGGEPTTTTSSAESSAAQTVSLQDNRSIHFFETFNLGEVLPGDVVEISFEQANDKASDVTIYASGMKSESYLAAMDKLQERAIDVTEWTANGIKANYTASQAGMLYLSIPYDPSWEARIDGEKVALESIGDEGLLAIPTVAGSHDLELKFIPKGFALGFALTAGGILLLALLLIDERKFREKRLQKFRDKRHEKFMTDWEEKEQKRLAALKSQTLSYDMGDGLDRFERFNEQERKAGSAYIYRVSSIERAPSETLEKSSQKSDVELEENSVLDDNVKKPILSEDSEVLDLSSEDNAKTKSKQKKSKKK